MKSPISLLFTIILFQFFVFANAEKTKEHQTKYEKCSETFLVLKPIPHCVKSLIEYNTILETQSKMTIESDILIIEEYLENLSSDDVEGARRRGLLVKLVKKMKSIMAKIAKTREEIEMVQKSVESLRSEKKECEGAFLPFVVIYGDGQTEFPNSQTITSELIEVTLPPCGFIIFLFKNDEKRVKVKVPPQFGGWKEGIVNVYEAGKKFNLAYCFTEDMRKELSTKAEMDIGRLKVKINFDFSLQRECKKERKRIFG